MQVQKNYKVYMHTNLKNQKKYVGITRINEKQRWGGGIGYKENKKFYKDIQELGWDGFSHDILYDNLSYTQARDMETKLIKKYNTIKEGYNINPSSPSKLTSFNFFDFAKLDTKKYRHKNETNYFTRIPNLYIQKDISKILGLNRIFLLVYILIDRNRNYENISYISIKQILNVGGYKTKNNHKKVFYEIIKAILFLHENNFINTNFDYYTIGYNECIKIEIIDENFDIKENFTKIYWKDLDLIMSANENIYKENILLVFLYINSYIGINGKNSRDEHQNSGKHPKAFWKSIENMSKDLSMSKVTINKCLQYLTNPQNGLPALLIKEETKDLYENDIALPKSLPNIYVLNKDGYENEIALAKQKIIEQYQKQNDEKQ